MDICPSARKFLNRQAISTIQKLIDDMRGLEANPFLAPDDRSKRPFSAPPLFLEYSKTADIGLSITWSAEC